MSSQEKGLTSDTESLCKFYPPIITINLSDYS